MGGTSLREEPWIGECFRNPPCKCIWSLGGGVPASLTAGMQELGSRGQTAISRRPRGRPQSRLLVREDTMEATNVLTQYQRTRGKNQWVNRTALKAGASSQGCSRGPETRLEFQEQPALLLSRHSSSCYAKSGEQNTGLCPYEAGV